MTYQKLAHEILSWPVERQLDNATLLDSECNEMYPATIATNKGEFDQIDVEHKYITIEEYKNEE